MATAAVKQQKLDEDGQCIGKANANPILDTRAREVQFPDGLEAAHSADIIAENMCTQCDSEGDQCLLLNSIVDHKKLKSAVHLRDSCMTVRGRRSQRKTTKGWKLCVEWKDGVTTWERLADLKESLLKLLNMPLHRASIMSQHLLSGCLTPSGGERGSSRP